MSLLGHHNFAIATRTYWNDSFLIPVLLMEELKFWRHNITAFNGYCIRPKYSFDYVIYTDVSGYGFGAYIDKSHITPVRCTWLHKEQAQRSTLRELKAIHNIVLCYAPVLRHSKVKIFSDSQNACSITQKGSTKPLLNDIVIDIFLLSLLTKTVELALQLLRSPLFANSSSCKASGTLIISEWKSVYF